MEFFNSQGHKNGNKDWIAKLNGSTYKYYCYTIHKTSTRDSKKSQGYTFRMTKGIH